MQHLRFKSYPAHPDVWMQPAQKSDGLTYYEYVLLYTDDTLVISENVEVVLRGELGHYFELKEESIGPPKLYLGGHICKVMWESRMSLWSFSSSQYVQTAAKNIVTCLSKWHGRWKLPLKVETPLKATYRPVLDVSPELGTSGMSYYQSLIGMLFLIVELGRVNICLEVSMMLSHLAMPQEGHMEQVLQIFAYLCKYHNMELVYDLSNQVINLSNFERQDWTLSEFGHIDGVEELPPKMSEPHGMGFMICAKVDAHHASDSMMRQSRTGFLVL